MQRRIELRHHLRRRSLLRPEHRRGALFAAQRVIDVAGGGHAHPLPTRIQPGEIEMRQLRQRRSARRQRPACLIQQLHAQRLHHPGTAVVGGAAADAENDRLHAAFQRRQHQFAGAVTGGDARIAPAGRRQVQP